VSAFPEEGRGCNRRGFLSSYSDRMDPPVGIFRTRSELETIREHVTLIFRSLQALHLSVPFLPALLGGSRVSVVDLDFDLGVNTEITTKKCTLASVCEQPSYTSRQGTPTF